MLLTVTPLENPGPPSPVPPPTPPKPRKDNAKLQRLLRKAAKKSGVQASPTLTTKTYRSTLSPVSEADLENIESVPQKQKKPLAINLPPRFQLKGVTHRAPSPYPKQKFTFTVSEQQSLSQYLSPSPVPDTPSPQPRSCSPNTLFLFPQGGNTSDRLSPRLIANSSPRPCTPQAKETSPKQPLVSHLQVLSTPAIIVHETNGKDSKPASLNKDEAVNTTQIDGFSTPTCEDTKLSKVSSCPRSIPAQKESTYKPTGYNSSSENEPIMPVSISTTSKMTDRTEIVHDLSKVVEIPQSRSTNDKRTTSVNPALTTVNPTVIVTSVPAEVTISPKMTGTTHVTSTKDNFTKSDMLPKSEEITILKSPEKPKPPRKKPGGGWARLVKHLVVEPEEPKFPEPQKAEDKTEKSVGEKKDATEGTQSKANRANKMWDALLYRMATTNKEQEKPGSTAPPTLPFFRSRLPLLLHRPRFDARKLKEAASRPLRRVTAFFHRRIAEKETSSSFNRTASGWSIRGEDAKQEDEKQAVDGDMKQ